MHCLPEYGRLLLCSACTCCHPPPVLPLFHHQQRYFTISSYCTRTPPVVVPHACCQGQLVCLQVDGVLVGVVVWQTSNAACRVCWWVSDCVFSLARRRSAQLLLLQRVHVCVGGFLDHSRDGDALHAVHCTCRCDCGVWSTHCPRLDVSPCAASLVLNMCCDSCRRACVCTVVHVWCAGSSQQWPRWLFAAICCYELSCPLCPVAGACRPMLPG